MTDHQVSARTSSLDEGLSKSGYLGADWYPSPWGADDQVGSGNHQGPATLLGALRFIRTGRVVRMGFTIDETMPMHGRRTFVLRMPGAPTGGPYGESNRAIWNDDFVAADLGQVGTHMDALGHFGYCAGEPGDNRQAAFYNGHSLADIWSPYGLTRLGIENAPVFFTRGLLLDVAGLKGRPLDKGEEISVADLQQCLDRQGVSDPIREGDAVIIRTGHTERYADDPRAGLDSSPGIGLEAARWLAEHRPSVVGADNYGLDVDPNPDPTLVFPAHHVLLTTHGIYIQENMKLDEIAASGCFEFAYVFVPLPVAGATGSPGTPIAIL